jgi:hypothetical protein
MTTWAKRGLGILCLGAAIAVGSDLWSLRERPVVPPAAVSEWRLSAPADCGGSVRAETQPWRGTAGARRICRAEYSGPLPMRLTLFAMPGSPGATAFDAFQKCRPGQPGRLCFFKGNAFGVIESLQADTATLLRFSVAMERALPGKGEGTRW